MKTLHSKPHQRSFLTYKCFLLLIILILSLTACQSTEEKLPIVVENFQDEPTKGKLTDKQGAPQSKPAEADTEVINSDMFTWIDDKGMNLSTRIHTPAGYARIPSDTTELSGFLRELMLKDSGSEVLLYDGNSKGNQDDHIAVFDLDVGDRDLQQCADSVMRIYAEYYWSIGAYDQIAFHLTNGFLMEYTKWRDGNRIVVDGNDVSWTSSSSFDDSYDQFRKYLNMVFAYAGTLSLSEECNSISPDEMRPGDLFLEGGSPGHCVLVVDAAENQNGERCYLLAQGYMPAQDFHVIKNPLHPEDPWYYESEILYPLQTPAWTFKEGSLVRWAEFPLNAAAIPLTFSNTDGANSSNSTASDAVTAISGEMITVTAEDSLQVNLLAVGDNLIHTQVIDSGKQEDGSYNYDHLYSNIKEEISAADIAVINQETILGGKKLGYSGYPNFNSPTEIGDAVINAGFDVVLHATNHTMDKGLKGVENTFAYWGLYPEITVLGINKTEEESRKIPIVEKNGIKIAMLNYTYSLNGHSLPEDMPYLVNMLDKKKMAEDIKEAEKLADFTIVFPHWGTEYVYEATKTQKSLTEFFYELGVDLVIGTHPHVIEPVEWIETKENHRMLVYYSLGNFISYQKEAPRMLGAIANITITKDENGTYISDAGITPIVTHFENGPADYNYAIYKLDEYTPELAKVHGVSELAKSGPITYPETHDLAIEVFGSWYPH